MEEIRNQHIRLQASCLGAEIQSLTRINDGYEYIWQADPAFWGKHSPLLFPITGRMWNDRTEFGGKEYHIPKHGFMNRRSFNLAGHDENSLRYVYASTDDDAQFFPFEFQLEITYTIIDNKVEVGFHVENCGFETMPFQIGGHPGFNLPDYNADDNVHGYLSFDGIPESLLRAGEQGCTEPDRIVMPMLEESLLPIEADLFAHDALIFDQNQVQGVTLHDKNRKPIVRLYGTAPCMLVWQSDKPGTSFICFEPWYGLCDPQHFYGPFVQRPYVNTVIPGKIWHGGYTIECLG